MLRTWLPGNDESQVGCRRGPRAQVECWITQRHGRAGGINSSLLSSWRLVVPSESGRVLVINPGSTSTKFGVFSRAGAEWVSSVLHDDKELEQFRGRSTLAQAD